jgi:hypothetical protein
MKKISMMLVLIMIACCSCSEGKFIVTGLKSDKTDPNDKDYKERRVYFSHKSPNSNFITPDIKSASCLAMKRDIKHDTNDTRYISCAVEALAMAGCKNILMIPC